MRIGHVGIYVQDFSKMLAFYQQALDLKVSDRGNVGDVLVAFLTGDVSDHHQLAVISGRPDGIVSGHLINQISFKVDDIATVQRHYHKIVAAGATEVTPKSHGNAVGVYFLDPEGNRFEVYCDTPWYVEQPHSTLIDMTRPLEEITLAVEASCRKDPSFRPVEEWQASFLDGHDQS